MTNNSKYNLEAADNFFTLHAPLLKQKAGIWKKPIDRKSEKYTHARLVLWVRQNFK